MRCIGLTSFAFINHILSSNYSGLVAAGQVVRIYVHDNITAPNKGTCTTRLNNRPYGKMHRRINLGKYCPSEFNEDFSTTNIAVENLKGKMLSIVD